jgi:hypothetical protein
VPRGTKWIATITLPATWETAMKLPTATYCAFAFLVLMPLLPVVALMLNGQPAVVFFTGAAVFFINLLLIIFMAAYAHMPLADAPPVVSGFQFTIRGVLCLSAFLIGIAAFMISGFQCEAAERANRPNPLPASVLLRFVWEMEFGLLLLTAAGIISIRSALVAKWSAQATH